MIEEQAVIVKLDTQNIWVEKTSTSGCAGCQQKSSCTTQAISQLLDNKSLRLTNTHEFNLGDKVTIAVDESVLLGASISMYCWPLIALFIGAFLADGFIEDTTAYKDFWVINSALLGLALSLIAIKQNSAPRYANTISIKKT